MRRSSHAWLWRHSGTLAPVTAVYSPIAERSFPVVFATHVARSASFYEALGFESHFQLPSEGEPGYIGLRRGASEIAIVSAEWPEQQYRLHVGKGVRFEMIVYANATD